MMIYGEEFDRRLVEQVDAVHEQMRELAGRIDMLMLDFCDRRSELAEHALGVDAGDERVIEDRDYVKALQLRTRWERLDHSLEGLHKAWVRQLPNPEGETAQ